MECYRCSNSYLNYSDESNLCKLCNLKVNGVFKFNEVEIAELVKQGILSKNKI
mgnify:CR=1 FL=1